jgi:predicted lipid-binding transport protein (Tim44 family)
MGFPIFDILLLALAAGVVYRLIYVLGSRTGNERPPRNNPFTHRDTEGQSERDGNVIPLPGAQAANTAAKNAQVKTAIDKLAPEGSPLASSLSEIQNADRAFEPGHFISGARSAYEMIVTSFAAGDSQGLKPLLSDDVFSSFKSVIDERKEKGNTQESSFVGIEKAEIIRAALKDFVAEITIKFVSEIISVTKNSDGAVVEGDPTSVRKITDIWTFARDTKNSNPNWKLIGTAAGQ